ncbi:MAG: replication initiation protein [Bacteroidota bacterium]
MAIVKHNKLIETSYKMNSREQFFVLYLISKISQNDSEFREYRMHYSEIERILNFDGKRRIANKNEVFSLMDRLNSVPIVYEKGTIVGKSVWLQHMEHDTETDEFTFSLSEKLRDYLLQLKEHFTQYNISNIVYLNSNAIRLYEVLKRYQFLGECTLEVEKIKFYLGIEGKYLKFYEFKRWVLIPCQKDIEKYADIKFEFMPARKKGKSIISLKFYISENTPAYVPENVRFLNGESARPRGPIATALQLKIDKLTYSQWNAFQFLAQLGVNRVFVVDQVLRDPKVNYAPLKGFEDVYMKILWKFLKEKSNSKSKAATFVTWWKRGKLTENNLHARMVEVVLKKKNEMSDSERDRREATKQMNKLEYGKYLEKEQNEFRAANAVGETIQIGGKPKRRGFNVDWFKNQFPNQYMGYLQEVKTEYVKAFESLGQEVDFAKYQNAIEDKVRFRCKEWWEKREQKVG